jgi:transposase
MKPSKRKPYSSDLNDEEWERIKPLIREDVHYGPKGRSKHSRKEMLNAIFYVVKTGCQWRELPNDFPLWTAVHSQFIRWKQKNLFEKIHNFLRASLRKALGRNLDASIGIADSQSVKTTEKKGFADLMGVRKLKVGKDTYWLITLD